MTLKTTIEKLRDIALKTHNVRSVIINDIYRENAFANVDYGVVAIIQNEHSVGDNIVTYNLTLVYVDRLAKDGSNELDIQSDGMLTLTNIINAFVGEVDDASIEGDVTFTAYNQRFVDDCAGVYADVAISVTSNMGICYDI